MTFPAPHGICHIKSHPKKPRARQGLDCGVGLYEGMSLSLALGITRLQWGGTYLVLLRLWTLLILHSFLFLKVVAEQRLQLAAALLIRLL